jgi:hypothetical protein
MCRYRSQAGAGHHEIVIPDQVEIVTLLARCAELGGEGTVALRVDTSELETAYVENVGGRVHVHDRGETFYYLATSSDSTYTPWSRDLAEQAAARFKVALEDLSDDKDAQSFRLILRLDDDWTVKAAVQAISHAIDAIFQEHTRPDLRRPEW